MEFSRQEYWSGLPFPSPGDLPDPGNLPDPGIEPGSPALQADALPSEPQNVFACANLPKSKHCWPSPGYRWLPWPSLVEGLVTSLCALHEKSLQSCLILCNPMDCSPPGSSVLGIFQVRILEWVVISSSRGTSQPRDGTHASGISCVGRWNLCLCAAWEALVASTGDVKSRQCISLSHHVLQNIFYICK